MALFFFGVLLTFVSVFLMLLILVQRGKGGGLTGALGGMGGQSAFGAKAGDAFTKITTITSIIWITLCMLTIAFFNPPPKQVSTKKPDASVSAPADSEGTGAAAATTGTGADTVVEEAVVEDTDEADPSSESGGEDYEIDLSPDDGTEESGSDNDSGPPNNGTESDGEGGSDNDSPSDG